MTRQHDVQLLGKMIISKYGNTFPAKTMTFLNFGTSSQKVTSSPTAISNGIQTAFYPLQQVDTADYTCQPQIPSGRQLYRPIQLNSRVSIGRLLPFYLKSLKEYFIYNIFSQNLLEYRNRRFEIFRCVHYYRRQMYPEAAWAMPAWYAGQNTE